MTPDSEEMLWCTLGEHFAPRSHFSLSKTIKRGVQNFCRDHYNTYWHKNKHKYKKGRSGPPKIEQTEFRKIVLKPRGPRSTSGRASGPAQPKEERDSRWPKAVIKGFGGRDACFGIDARLCAIEVAHIKDHAKCTPEEKIDSENGFPFTVNIHRLFDAHLVTFNREGWMVVSPELDPETALLLIGRDPAVVRLRLPLTPGQLRYLEEFNWPEFKGEVK